MNVLSASLVTGARLHRLAPRRRARRRGHDVVVLDDLETGFRENVDPRARLAIGSVADEDVVRDAVEGCELVFHQAAHKAVLRSVEHPLDHRHRQHARHADRAEGRARRRRPPGRARVVEQRLRRGGAAADRARTRRCMPRSPYAVSKLAAEEYCRVFTELYGLETVALRYFNVYGPRQRPDATYAAVIPLFVDALLNGRDPVVHGDGLQSRDFTYITDVVAANLAAGDAPAESCAGRVYNIAGGTVLDAARRARGCSASCSASSRTPSSSRPAPATCATAAPTRARPRATSASAPDVGLDDGLGRDRRLARTLVRTLDALAACRQSFALCDFARARRPGPVAARADRPRAEVSRRSAVAVELPSRAGRGAGRQRDQRRQVLVERQDQRGGRCRTSPAASAPGCR